MQSRGEIANTTQFRRTDNINQSQLNYIATKNENLQSKHVRRVTNEGQHFKL